MTHYRWKTELTPYCCFSGLALLQGAGGEPGAARFREGLLFLNPEQVFLTHEEWRVVVEINITEVTSGVEALGREVGRVTGILMGMSQWEQIPAVDQALGEIHQTAEVISEYQREASELGAYLPQARHARGLFNGGGSLLKAVFGNPDADDWAAMERGWAVSQQKQGALIHAEKEHLLYSRQLGMQVGEQGRRLVELANTTGLIAQTLADAMGTWRDALTRLEVVNNATAWMSQTLRQLALGTIRAGETLRNTRRGVEEAARGRVSSLLLSPRVLSQMVTQIQEHLPEGVQLLAGGDALEAHTHYQSAEVHGWATPHTLHIAVSLPLVRETSQYTSYDLLTIPLPEQESGCHLKLELPHSRFLIRQDLEFFAELGPSSLDHCRRTPKLVCRPKFPVQHRSEATCILNLFFGVRPSPQACEWRILTGGPQAQWTWTGEGTGWHYALKEPTPVTHHCPGQPPRVEELRGSGILRPQPHCTVRTPTHLLWPVGQDQSVRTLGVVFPTLHTGSPTLLKDLHPTANLTMLKQAIQQLKEQGRTQARAKDTEEARLEDALQELEHLQQHSPGWNPHVIWGGAGGTGGLALIGILALVWWFRYRQPHPNPNPTTYEKIRRVGLRQVTPLVIHRPSPRAVTEDTTT